jgi:hypothetical protein
MNEWDLERNNCLADEEEWTSNDDVRTNERLIWLENPTPATNGGADHTDADPGGAEPNEKLAQYGLHLQKWVDAYCPRTEQVRRITSEALVSALVWKCFH